MSSVRIISSRETVIRKALEEYIAKLKVRPEVVAVYLCGSWAKGTYTPYSDVDLLILIKGDSRRPHERVPDYLPDRFPVGVDLFIYTLDELKNNKFAQQLLSEGVEL